MSFRIKKGDSVVVISGKDKGREGKVTKVFPGEGLLTIDGMNLRKRHQKPRRAGEKGSIIQVSAPLRMSKVLPKCPHCGKAVRIGRKLSSGAKARICKKCGGEF